MAFVALITGASSGIGEATARRLAREPDVKLVLVARRVQRLDELARALGGATVIALDLTAPGAPERVLEAVQRRHGELHMLVNNAGAAWRGRFGDTGWAGVQRHMELNFEAPVRLTEALLPLLRATASGPGGNGRRVCIRQRRQHREPGLAPRLGRLLGSEVRPRRLDRRPLRRGARARHPHRAGAARVR